MFCPVCRSEYRAGFTTCKNCGDVPLVETLPKKVAMTAAEIAAGKAVGFSDPGTAQLVEVDGHKVDVTRIFALDRAADLKALLDEGGVESAIVPLDVDFPDNVPRFEVRVRATELERAQTLLLQEWQKTIESEAGGAGGPVSFDSCPACGATVPLDVEECPDCGLFVGVGAERGGEAAAEE